jgi:hypothetical protein
LKTKTKENAEGTDGDEGSDPKSFEIKISGFEDVKD